MFVAVLAAALAAGQLPTPTKLLQARQVFLVGDGIDRASLEELARRVTSWGRWTLTAEEATADLVVSLARRTDAAPGQPASADAGHAVPSAEYVWLLTIRERDRSTTLYSDSQRVGASPVVSIGDLVDRLRGTVGVGPPPSAEGTAGVSNVGEASPSVSSRTGSEPCRVFVTEEKVNPSFYTVVKRIKYAKKYYGGSSHAWEGMAREGWKAKADAVVAVNINFRPSMFSWASPHAEGIAVRWNDEGRRQFAKIQGQCFPESAP
jgi:hypothetical protein